MSAMKVKCPRCGGEALFSSENPFRPFCSERCKLIDLGAWASGKYAIPAQSSHDTNPQSLSEHANDDEQMSDETGLNDSDPSHLH